MQIAAKLHAARADHDQLLIVAQSNAGLPQLSGDQFEYTVDPEQMAQHAKQLRELGVDVIGACCGSSPEHIAAIAQAAPQMSVVWLGFLYYPATDLIEFAEAPAANPWFIALGWAALVAFAACYLAGFVFGMRAGWHQPSRLVVALFFAAIACAALTSLPLGWHAVSFVPLLMAYASYVLGTVWHWVTAGAAIALLGNSSALTLSGSLSGYAAALAAAIIWATYSVGTRLLPHVPTSAMTGICAMTAAGAGFLHLATETTRWPLAPSARPRLRALLLLYAARAGL